MIEPINLQILIKPDGKKIETASGLYTGVYSVEGPLRRGTVVAIAKNCTDLKVGDRVCWLIQHGKTINIDNTDHVLMYETEVEGWLENESN